MNWAWHGEQEVNRNKDSPARQKEKHKQMFSDVGLHGLWTRRLEGGLLEEVGRAGL